MKTIYHYCTRIACMAIVAFSASGCQKYLDEKRNQFLAIPSTLDDIELVANNSTFNSSRPNTELLTDNFFVTSATLNSSGVVFRDNYLFAGGTPPQFDNWSVSYNNIKYSNFILDYLPVVAPGESATPRYKKIKGLALFNRAFQFHMVAQIWCKPYGPTAATDMGIVLPLTSGVRNSSSRATVEETYQQIIGDLKAAVDLLPSKVTFNTAPDKGACYAMLSRVYLSMNDYPNAKTYADKALTEHSDLLDYNKMTAGSVGPFPDFLSNPEIYFESTDHFTQLEPSTGNVDSVLYQSYASNDLRKTLFFGTNGTRVFWAGSYSAKEFGFTYGISNGPTTAEIYLTRAECKARTNDKDGALADLNTLLVKRWKTGTFTNVTANDANDALNKILAERRKELLFRDIRWMDLRRLNVSGANLSVTHVYNGTSYTLAPNDLRWTLLIPFEEIQLGGIAQNPR